MLEIKIFEAKIEMGKAAAEKATQILKEAIKEKIKSINPELFCDFLFRWRSKIAYPY